MKWIKQGLVFAPHHKYDWMVSHAAVPVVDEVRDGVLRIYFGTRDGSGRSHPGYVEVEAARPDNLLYVHDEPLLSLGRRGTFDEGGIIPSWLGNQGGKKYLYYIGWSPQVTVPYRLAIGLAISEDGGDSFQKISEGPICDRSFDEPFFNTAPCVLVTGGKWQMWYSSCTGWEILNGVPEARYHLKYADSVDGITWRKTGLVCLEYDDFMKAIGRPAVFHEDGLYKMFYSYRGILNYRTDREQSYRLGYAESRDGIVWTRRDEDVGIDRSADGWDSEMIEYAYRFEHRGRKYLFYNGNGFGATGFGYAVLHED
ncbi:MAG TPA: hypothetical protein VHP99_13025 [Pyrinomonadaceae bacterium]|jgi:hypothetical protein|nr:hypothetical protein [Pyrinomonadaceae bacterium]